MAAVLTELVVGDEPAAWESAGFAVDDGQTTIGSVRVRFDPSSGQRGLVGWSLDGVATGSDIDGLPAVGDTSPPAGSAADHPNGVEVIDHVVVVTPDLDRTTTALGSLGIEARRSRDVGTPDSPRRQVFFWLGEPILELVGPTEPTGDGPARFYGLAVTVADIDATAAALGDAVGRVKDAVQPGRRITTLRHRDLDLSIPVAFMSHHVRPDHA